MVLQRSTARPTTSRGSRHGPLLLFGLSTSIHGSLLVDGSTCQLIVGQVEEQVQTVLQLDGKPIAEEVGFLFICVNMVGPILDENVELACVVLHRVVPLL
jgi:hypothetical protein